MNQLADYLQYMQTDDVLAATEKAKVQARIALEDQGITMLALLLADFLGETLWHGVPENFTLPPKKRARKNATKRVGRQPEQATPVLSVE